MNPMMPMMQMMNQNSGFPNFGKSPQTSQFDLNQFKSYLPRVSQYQMEQLVQQARQQGISDSDIQAGINMMNNMR